MGNVFFDVGKAKSVSSDSFTRCLSSILLYLSGINEMNKLSSSLKTDFSDPAFVSELFGINSISVRVSDFNIPKTGSFVVLVPVISGLLEVLSSIAAVIDTSGRHDVKLFVSDPGLSKISALKSYFLPKYTCSVSSQLSSAVKHLNSGGGVVYFQQFSFNSNQIGFDTLDMPLKLAKLTQSPLFPMIVDYDILLFNSLSYFLGNWFYLLFSVRRFLSFKGVVLSMSFGEPLGFYSDIDSSLEKLKDLFKLTIHKDNLESFITLPFALLMQVKNAIVPRGTK